MTISLLGVVNTYATSRKFETIGTGTNNGNMNQKGIYFYFSSFDTRFRAARGEKKKEAHSENNTNNNKCVYSGFLTCSPYSFNIIRLSRKSMEWCRPAGKKFVDIVTYYIDCISKNIGIACTDAFGWRTFNTIKEQ